MKPTKRSAWLITWESRRRDVHRPRVVAILNPQTGSSMIKTFLRVLFVSESRLTFSEKIHYALTKQNPGWIRQDVRKIYCGHNPWLEARLVKDLHVDSNSKTSEETLHWTEYDNTPNASEHEFSETANFDRLWLS